ncbi:hypothetical protein BaRGS_00034116 [Batillaria attramentaria]|uniref:Uncharacterized protein n=1 Tax=Batillaria attramentaria TaxID=370345 RepID=A0ABD0JI12_9CAEN
MKTTQFQVLFFGLVLLAALAPTAEATSPSDPCDVDPDPAACRRHQTGLNDYILDYQTLHYDPLDLHAKHDRVRRSIDPHLHLDFSAYGR